MRVPLFFLDSLQRKPKPRKEGKRVPLGYPASLEARHPGPGFGSLEKAESLQV